MMLNDKPRIPECVPAITLMALAPILAEILPGATRFSSLFVFPIEVCVWGGGVILIRYAVRRWGLGWLNMLFLAIALSIAEECLIQQTSLAPMVLKIKGVEYGRAMGVNYVYFLWALVYETVFVVFLPIYLAELIFVERRDQLWIGKRGIAVILSLFVLGSCLAWYSWTQMARPNVFHVPPYNPPLEIVFLAVALIGGLIVAALGPFRNRRTQASRPWSPPRPWVLAGVGGLWAVILYGLVLLAFGILPSFPPWIAVGVGLFLAAGALCVVPRWTRSPRWNSTHVFSVIFGVMAGSMLAGFIAFIGAAPVDLYFKILVNLLAVISMLVLGFRIKRAPTERSQ